MNHFVSGALALMLLASPFNAIAHDTGAHAASEHAAAGPVVALGDLQISGAFARATLPNAPVGAGYLTILNTGGTDDRLVSASSSVAGMTQLHEMKMEGDVMKMAELPNGIDIPAGSTVVLQPGGLHIMLMDLKEALVEGTTVTVTLTFEKAGTVDVPIAVGAINADEAMHADHAAHAAHAGAMQMDSAGLSDVEAIAHMQKAMFDTAEDPLQMGPIIVVGEYAVSDWAQKNMAGRALLRKTESGWAIHLCSGAGLRDAANLTSIGVPQDIAMELAKDLAEAEAHIDAALLSRYDSFDGTMMVDEGLI